MKNWKAKADQLLQELFPEKRKEIMILIALLPVLWLLSLFAKDNDQIKVLLRPGFQEPEQRITLSYKYQGEFGFTDDMAITLKQHEEKSEIIKRKLEKTAEDFRQYFFRRENFTQIQKTLKLPDRWRQAEISYVFFPENLWLEDGEWNYFELFESEAERNIGFGVTLSYQEESVFLKHEVTIRATDFDSEYVKMLLRKKLKKKVELLQEAEKEELVLPPELEGGEVKWQALQSRIDFRKMLAFLLIFLVLMSLLSRATAKEKERQRKRAYLRDFGQILHHLVLLLKCGKTPYSAMIEVCRNQGEFSPDFQVAKEKCYQKIYHQEHMKTAISAFREQCDIAEIKRFEQLFLMAYERGDEWSVYYLEQFRDEIFAKRLREVNEYMQKATSRLVFPMVLFLIVIIIVTIVPAFEGM